MTWTGAQDNSWENPGNWSTNAVPGTSDDVSITAAVGVTVTVASTDTTTVRSLTADTPLAILGDLTVTQTANLFDNLSVGASASLKLQDGGTLEAGNIAIDTGGVVALTGGSFYLWSSSGIDVTGAGSFQVDGATAGLFTSMQVQNLVLDQGGSIRSGLLTVTGSFTWNDGTLSCYQCTIDSGCTLSLTGSATNSLNDVVMENYGQIEWTGTGSLDATGDSVITNEQNADFDLWSDANLLSSDGSAVFNNYGSFTKWSDSGESSIDAEFNNDGSLETAQGTLSLQNGGSLSGSVSVDAGSTLTLAGGSFNIDTNLTGSGLVEVAAATVNLETATQIQNLLLDQGGTITGSGSLEVTGSAAWADGTISCSAFTIDSSCAMDLTSSTTMSLDGVNFDNQGQVVWSGSGNLDLEDGTVITNESSAAFTIQTNANMLNSDGTAVINNHGTFTASGGNIAIAAAFNSDGTLTTIQGTFSLQNGGTLSDNVVVEGSATMTLGNGSFNLDANISGLGLFEVAAATANLTGTTQVVNLLLDQGGTITGIGSLEVTSSATWAQGTISCAAVTIDSGSTMDLTSSTTMALNGVNFDNQGQVVWSGSGDLDAENGTVITNAASAAFTIQTDASVLNADGTAVINNHGTFTASGGNIAIAAAFNSDGDVQIQSGTLLLQGGGTTTGTVETSAGTTLAFASDYTLSASSSVTGTGMVDFVSGTVSIAGAIQASGGITVETSGMVNGVGTLTGELTNNGTINVGGTSGFGTLALIGDLTNTSTGYLNFQIGGANPGINYDQLNVTGIANFDGTLTLNATDGYVPATADRIAILTYSTFTGGFGAVNGLAYAAFQFTPFILPQVLKLIGDFTGQTVHVWTGMSGIDSNWSTAKNWSDASVPKPGDKVIFAATLPAGNVSACDVFYLAGSNSTIGDIVITPTFTGQLFIDGDLDVTGTIADYGSNQHPTFADQPTIFLLDHYLTAHGVVLRRTVVGLGDGVLSITGAPNNAGSFSTAFAAIIGAGDGGINVDANSQLNVLSYTTFVNTTVTVLGTTNWQGGDLFLPMTNFYNDGTFNAYANTEMRGVNSGVFYNYGTFNKLSSGITQIVTKFESLPPPAGTPVTVTNQSVNVSAGTLDFRRRGDFATPFNVDLGATLEFSVAPEDLYSGAIIQGGPNGFGSFLVDEQAQLDVQLTTVRVLLPLTLDDGAALGGQGVPFSILQLSNSFTWIDGTIGPVEVEAYGTNMITGNREKDMFWGRLDLYGATTWNGDGNIVMVSSAIYNYNRFEIQNDQEIQDNSAQGDPVSYVYNEQNPPAGRGVIIKTAGFGGTTITANFENDGGVLNLNGFNMTFGGTVVQRGGDTILNGGTLASTVNVISLSGLLLGTGTIQGSIDIVGGGIVNVGARIGTLNVSQNITFQAGSTLTVMLAGLTVFDALNVTGMATVSSSALLKVIQIRGYQAEVGDSFGVFTANAGVTGCFTADDPAVWSVLPNGPNGINATNGVIA